MYRKVQRHMENRQMSRRSFVKHAGAIAAAFALLPATAHGAELRTAQMQPQALGNAGDSAPGIAAQSEGSALGATSLAAQAAASSKTAIVCFSCTGNTWAVAKRIRKATGGTLVRVKPKAPYSQADIDYDNAKSRVNKEHGDIDNPAKSRVRPAIANLAQIRKAVKSAKVVYVGYPIWFGEAPHIVYTLVEKLSLKGKRVVPFCTSGGSGLGPSAKHLKSQARISKKTTWEKGRNFYDIPSQNAVNKWVK